MDLDGTLAQYHGWAKWSDIGEPVSLMLDRVKKWVADGVEVRIVTARMGHDDSVVHRCKTSGERFTNALMAGVIMDWTKRHVGVALTVTCFKDVDMLELWDDRAVQVVPNTGRTLAEEHEAVVTALRGAP